MSAEGENLTKLTEEQVGQVKECENGTATTEDVIEDDGRPKIISNELLQLTETSISSDKADELLSLEREIAEMHVEVPTLTKILIPHDGISDITGSGEGTSEVDALERELSRNITPVSDRDTLTQVCEASVGSENTHTYEAACTTLGDEDLIAVLKGIDRNVEPVHSIQAKTPIRPSSITESELAEGVTIEGEGQFEFMEVIDDEMEELEPENIDDPAVSSSKPVMCQNNATPQLTDDEIRAMAMEQIAGLSAVVSDRQRRRKQDIKPLPVEEPTDLVSSLGAEWSDDDVAVDAGGTKNAVKPKNNKAEPRSRSSENNSTIEKNISPKILENIESNSSVDVSVNKNDGYSNPKKDVNAGQQQVGFRRTRIIKRKIIWDPDAPETQISYAKLVRNSTKTSIDEVNKDDLNAQSSKKKSMASINSSQQNTVATPKKESLLKKSRSDAPKGQVSLLKVKRAAVSQNIPISEKKIIGKVGNTTITTTTANIAQNTKRSYNEDTVSGKTQTQGKLRSQTPIANGAGSKKKKSSEIDRLVSDEGAANMLHSLENEISKYTSKADDKPHKPLMRNRSSAMTERYTNSPVNTSPTLGKNKRTTRPKRSTTWDYVYEQQAREEAMIIRRRSNSSYSSNASLRRLSSDTPVTNKSSSTKADNQNTSHTTSASSTKVVSKAERRTSGGNSKQIISDKGPFEFAKPESKSSQKVNRRVKNSPTQDTNPLTTDMKKSQGSGNRRTSKSPAAIVGKEEELCAGRSKSSSKATVEDFVVNTTAKVTEILFNSHNAKLNCTFTAHLMNKLAELLNKLGKDDECSVVVMVTNAPHFCRGIDFTDLTVGSDEDRIPAAIELSTAVKNYLKALATFPKPLIAGVHGNNVGLGVTQLTLFDYVVASDKSTYETLYPKIGQLPEGYCIWLLPTKIQESYKKKLLWLCEKLHSSDSLTSGLVDKLTAPSKVNEDALLIGKQIAAMSSQTYRSMKKPIIKNHKQTIIATLEEECNTIVHQWISPECYGNFKKYLDVGHF